MGISSSAMILPTQIKLLCYLGNLKIAGIFFCIQTKAKHKNNFNLIVGPTNDEGEIVVRWTEIEKDISWHTNTFPMDYTGIADITGEINIRIADSEDIIRALNGYEIFSDAFTYKPYYKENLEKSKVLIDNIDSSALSFTIEHDGRGLTVSAG